jgi:sugar/nucleoside kinase (ribokinase family)
VGFPGIYVTGNVVVDTLVRPADSLPEWGSTTYVDSIAMRLGGNASGAACAAAMMGVPTRIAGMVGDDAPGAYARERLEECGVDVERLIAHQKEPTAATVGLVHSGGERLFFHVSGASGAFSLADISFDPEAIEGYKFFHYGSVFCLPAMRNHAAELLSRARAAGLITSLDTDWDTDGQWAELFDPLCGLIDYLFVNTQEGERLTGSSEPQAIAQHFRERGAGSVIVKAGAEGCRVFTDDGDFSSPAFDVPVVDTTGAGDCFCGGFLAGLSRGFDLQSSAQLANAVAAHSIQAVGNTDGLVPFDAVSDWISLKS